MLPRGTGERFAGYGVMSCPFASGDLLCLRRFPASSVGPAYTSVWHRAPTGTWSFYQNAPLAQFCPRYFSSALGSAAIAAITVTWTGDNAFEVNIPAPIDLHWQVVLGATLATRLLNRVAPLIPERLWQQRAFLAAMSRVAGGALGAGKLALAGQAPNGQGFIANPRQIWTIPTSQATLGSRAFGDVAVLGGQARLGDFWIPARGLFAIGNASFTPFDPERHHLPEPTPA